MTLQVYADETGTHHGAEMIALAGLIETQDYWNRFNSKWQLVLQNYGADFFHYREFRKVANTKMGAPYYGWSEQKRQSFLLHLAMLVGESAVPTGGAWPVEHNKKLGRTNDPFQATIHAFYQSTRQIFAKHWPNYSGKALFIFDNSSNKEWVKKICKIHKEHKNKDSRIGDILFENDRNPAHMGLQAADLSAIHSRNNAEEYMESEGGIFDMGIIDFILGKNIDVEFRNLPTQVTKKIIDDMRKDESKKRKEGFTGRYVPLRHFDFKKHKYQK